MSLLLMSEVKNSKIAFVLGGLNYGGAERVASRMIQYWHEQNRPLAIISRRGPENDFFEISNEIERYNLGGEGASANKVLALFKNIPFVYRLRKAIKKSGADVVVSFLTKTNIHTILASAGLGIRVVISERNDTTRQNYPWPWPWLRKQLYRYSDVVSANSEIALSGMESYVPSDKLYLVENPVEFPIEKAKPGESSLILNVGRLVPQKAQHILLEAFAGLPLNIQEIWDCHFLGDGELLQSLQKRSSELGVESSTIFHGVVKYPDVYYKKAGIFVLSSKFEGTPNVLLEAMAHGLPVIVSDSLPGALEFVKDGKNGYIFRNGDSSDLKQKMHHLIDNPELRNLLGENSRKLVSRLSIKNVMVEWNKIVDYY